MFPIFPWNGPKIRCFRPVNFLQVRLTISQWLITGSKFSLKVMKSQLSMTINLLSNKWSTNPPRWNPCHQNSVSLESCLCSPALCSASPESCRQPSVPRSLQLSWLRIHFAPLATSCRAVIFTICWVQPELEMLDRCRFSRLWGNSTFPPIIILECSSLKSPLKAGNPLKSVWLATLKVI